MEQKENKNYEFRKSDAAELIKKRIELDKEMFDNIDEFNKKENVMFKIDKNIVKHALIKICDAWNSDKKSRGFLKHLIASFFNTSSFDKVMTFSEDIIKDNKNVCAIMSYKLTGIKNIAELASSLLIDKAKIDVAENEEQKKEAIESYNKKVNEIPQEIRLKRFAWCSEKSNKYLSNEAKVALLNYFWQEMLFNNDREFLKLASNIRREKFGLNNINNKPKHNKQKYNKPKTVVNQPKYEKVNAVVTTAKKLNKSIGNNPMESMLSSKSIDNLNKIKNGNW